MTADDSPPKLSAGVIAVTGALGFVASRLVPRLLARGAHVRLLVRPGREPAARAAFPGLDVRATMLDAGAANLEVFRGASAMVHLAGLSLAPDFLPAAVGAGVSRGVFVSSAGVHTRLASGSADAKRAGEQAVRDSPLGYTILRPSMIYGSPRDRNIVRLLRWLQVCPLVPAPLGGVTPQQPIHFEDVADTIVAALERPAALRGEYDIGGPRPLTLRELIETCARALRRRAWIVPLPLRPAHAVASLARRWGVPIPVRPEQLLRLAESKAVDIAPAVRDLGVRPRAFEDGVRAEVAELLAGRARG